MGEVFTVIDFETTGLDHNTEQIIEVAALKIDSEGNEIGRFHTLVGLEEGRKLPEFITKLTGIKAEDLTNAPEEKAVAGTLYMFCHGTTVVAQNIPFEYAFVSKYADERNPLAESFICTRALSRLVEPTESASLKDVCERHGIELNGHHRAMNDVIATVEVFKLMRDKADSLGIGYRNVVINSPERPLSYIPPNAIVKEAV